MVNDMTDRISKQRLHVILIVDCSTSMRGKRIGQVNDAIGEIQKYLSELQEENANVDFYLTIISYATDAYLYRNERTKAVNEFSFSPLRTGGQSNLHLAYSELEKLLQKETKGGIMPDFGGVAPIILLMTDGHPTKDNLKEELSALRQKPWFNVALKYGIAIELNDQRTMKHLQDFVGGNGDVIECFDAGLLKKIIKIIVLTASKVRSQSGSVHAGSVTPMAEEAQMQVRQALAEVDDWEW